MATVIKASCPECGDVEIGIADICVLEFTYPSAEVISKYVFNCPIDKTPVTKPAEPRIVDMLVASGVRVQEISMPERKDLDAPQLTIDDQIDFHQELDDLQYVEQFGF